MFYRADGLKKVLSPNQQARTLLVTVGSKGSREGALERNEEDARMEELQRTRLVLY